jgi:hypothetical protein
MQLKKWTGVLLLSACAFATKAQVTGGQHTMEFLRLSNSPRVTALGGINVANTAQDISFALQNPSLIRPGLHNQLGLNYNAFYSGISLANLQYAYHAPKIATSFALGVQYLNYGSLSQTDVLGNDLGDFKANEYAITLGASREYGTRWRYGAALKWANSKLYDKAASALLADVGVHYYDTANLLNIGIVAKNMGFMARKYNKTNPAEPLPFDLQIGVAKKFKHLPLTLMATVHHLYEWDIRYNNPADIQNSVVLGSDSTTKTKSYFADKLFRHFIFGAEINLGKRLDVSVGYNHLHRGELAIKDKTGMAGFSFGAAINLNKFRVQYARSYYHIAGAMNEFGLIMTLNKLFDVSAKSNAKLHFNDTYEDWSRD